MNSRIVIEPYDRWWNVRFKELWNYRELLYFMLWKNIKVRYRQTVLGFVWLLMRPIASIAVFTFVFHKIAKISAGDIPYPIFALTGILPWSYFSTSLNGSTTSLLGSAGLIRKVFFPRLVIPIGAVLTGWVDFGIYAMTLVALMIYFKIVPGITVVAAPCFLVLAMLVALGAGLWLSPVNVRYRDVGNLMPFVTQFWMFLTPVVYPSHLVPESLQWVYQLNPMLAVVEGFRWAVFGTPFPLGAFFISLGTAVVLCLSGAIFFQRMERTLADVI